MSDRERIDAFKKRTQQRIDNLEEQLTSHADAKETSPHLDTLRDDLAELRRQYETMTFKEDDDIFDRERDRFDKQVDDLYNRFLAARKDIITY